MTPKERMLTALMRGKPDRLPATIHQWQDYHLKTFMGGVDALEAYKVCGLDASIQYWEAMGQFWIPDAEKFVVSVPDWRDDAELVDADPLHRVVHHTVSTPGGTLTYKTEANDRTTWITEYLIKRLEDVGLIAKYMPVPRLSKDAIAREYERVGDEGILRGFVWGDQAGCWQHACCLMNLQDMVLAGIDDPAWLHSLLRALMDKKLRFIEDSLAGARFDIIETGGGAGSDTVISPGFHREFCLPYDREMHQALHAVGHKAAYHTCGGMMHILDQIIENECDASETLSPPGVGGNISEPALVRDFYAGRIAMIGGMDQFNVLTEGSHEAIRQEAFRLFEGFGRDGGYVMSASDHFFDTPVENLKAFGDAARECGY